MKQCGGVGAAVLLCQFGLLRLRQRRILLHHQLVDHLLARGLRGEYLETGELASKGELSVLILSSLDGTALGLYRLLLGSSAGEVTAPIAFETKGDAENIVYNLSNREEV